MTKNTKYTYTELEHNHTYPDASEHRIVCLRNDEVVTFIYGVKKSGISKNGIPWSKWRDDNILTFSTRPRGKSDVNKLNVYNRVRRRTGGWRASPFTNVSPSASKALISFISQSRVKDESVFYGYLNELFSQRLQGAIPVFMENPFDIMKNIYPAFRGFSDMRILTESANPVLGAAREQDLANFTKKLFGKRKYRKDLVTALSQVKSLDELHYAYMARNAVPMDWVISGLKKYSQPENKLEDTIHSVPVFPKAHKIDQKDFNAFLSSLRTATRRKLTEELFSRRKDMYMHIDDTLKSFLMIKEWVEDENFFSDIKMNSWKEIHDYLALVIRQNKEKIINAPISFSVNAEQLHDLTTNNGFKIVAAQNGSQVVEWGQTMSNCIASYINDARSHKTDLFGVYKEDVLLGNMEIRNNSVRQLLGKYNRPLQTEVRDEVLDAIMTKVPKIKKPEYSGYMF